MKRIAILAGCCLLGACAASKPFVLSDAGARGSIHVASAFEDGKDFSIFDPAIFIVTVDGKLGRSGPLNRLHTEAYVTPGHHVFELRYVQGTEGFGDVKLALDAQSGHEYIIEEIDGPGRRFLLRFRDGWNGPVVGGLVD